MSHKTQNLVRRTDERNFTTKTVEMHLDIKKNISYITMVNVTYKHLYSELFVRKQHEIMNREVKL